MRRCPRRFRCHCRSYSLLKIILIIFCAGGEIKDLLCVVVPLLWYGDPVHGWIFADLLSSRGEIRLNQRTNFPVRLATASTLEHVQRGENKD